MNTLVNAMKNEGNRTHTTNGMKMLKSSTNAVVDLFFAVGASRGNGRGIVTLFQKAVAEDMDLAVRVALYARDVREGMGERQLFRDMMTDFAQRDYKNAMKVLPKIPELGRYDDLLAFVGTSLENEALALFAEALHSRNGLAAKWAPREKSAKKALAVKLRKHMGLDARSYRKMLVEMTDVVEQDMCAKNWSEINFSHVPSVAAARYQKAFLRNDENRYREYLSKLEKGDEDVKINAGAVYPYQIVQSLTRGESRAAEQQWQALPDWIDSDKSFVPLIDVSGSMSWSATGNGGVTPMDVAVSLGIYCAQRAKSAFKDTFLTFTDEPEWVDISNLSLTQAVRKTKSAPWGGSTDVERAYEQILRVAVKNNVPQADMPEFLIIFSDMQFNAANNGKNAISKNIEQKFTAAGYDVPLVVYWNLNDYGTSTPVKFDKNGSALVSGFSPSLMKSVLSMDVEQFNPINIVKEAVLNSRYDW